MGGYIMAEWNSLTKTNPIFRNSVRALEDKALRRATEKWFPTKTPIQACGYLTPKSGVQFGRTSILPELFDDVNGNAMSNWRQSFDTAGNQIIITGGNAGNVLPEDFQVAWLGLAFPNKQQHITEIKYYIGDRKYGRLNLEEMHIYGNPAIIFEEGLIIDEEETFELYAFVEGPIPSDNEFVTSLFQSVVMLGSTQYKVIDKVLGNCGAQIT